MKKLSFLVIFFLYLSIGMAQDQIMKADGSKMVAKVERITRDSVFARSADSLTSHLAFTKSDLSAIFFHDGVKIYFTGNAPDNLPADSICLTADYLRGVEDANLNYTNYSTAGTITLLTSMVFPVVGLIPALSCSHTSPRPENLGIVPNPSVTGTDYLAGYTRQAKRIKSKKVWKNYAIGAGIGVSYRLLYAAAAIVIISSLGVE